jgi:hypothetical protein
MLRKPDLALDATLADVEQTLSVQRIWVIDENGRVSHTGNRAVVGRVLNKTQDSVCRVLATLGTSIPLLSDRLLSISLVEFHDDHCFQRGLSKGDR